MKRIYLAFFALLTFSVIAQAEVKIQVVTSPGGITAWLVEEHSIPFTALEIRFLGGASLDPKGKRGAINLMTGLLEEGAADRDAREFAAAAEGLAASFGFDVSDDSMSVSAQFLTENRNDALALLRTAVQEPRFDEDAITRVKAQVVSAIQSAETDPDAISGSTFDRLAFGDHPYATSINGTLESVAALTRDDLFAAKDAVMARDRMYVGAVGDITPEELGKLLDNLLGDLPAVGANMPEQAPFLLKGGTTVVPFDTPQSVVTFGQEGLERHDPDFFAAYVMNTILGGSGRQSRLMEEVREKRGLTYGVYTYLLPKDFAALYMGRVASANDRVAQAVQVIKDEWVKMAENGVTAEELEGAKTYLTGAYPLRFDGNGPIANILVAMQMDDLPIDYIKTRNDRINAVTLEDIARVAKRLVRPDDLHFVVVGQPEGLESTE
ncbi:M16 family metallopeptidase [Profundibacter amoris]|uniref:Insulinase family protein n=1 Tax=Profundibacter amoris TaxID=2171755 RepID=A0A347UDD7_9RHOB|nr:pitrilysin family protein [Profundibacter amoris]AXX96865.1 insulinase family protein [Profundibacter amoris]